jgi:predicted amidophosphoribosyltransferase
VRWQAVVDFLFPAVCASCDAYGSGLCAACFHPVGPLPFALGALPCVALGTYDGALRAAVLALKSGRRDVAQALGTLLVPLVRAAPAVDALVPVPTGAARRRARGFDQGALLAGIAGRESGIAVVTALRKARGRAQHGRSRAERLTAAGCFACAPASLSPGARVLLVDDVATTGASLRDCAGALAAAGIRVAGAVVVARAL